MKRIILVTILLLYSATMMAQSNTYRVGKNNELISTKVTVGEDVKTLYTLEIKDIVYSVYKSVGGKYYIVRTSQKTGNQYKQYIKIETSVKIKVTTSFRFQEQDMDKYVLVCHYG